VQAHHVGGAQQFGQGGQLAGVAQRQLAEHVHEDHLHAQRFGQHRQL